MTFLLSLNLLVLWIDFADHAHLAAAAYDLAFFTNFLDRGSNFHLLTFVVAPSLDRAWDDERLLVPVSYSAVR